MPGNIWSKKWECATDTDVKALEAPLLARQINYVWESSEFYRNRFKSAGIKPGEVTDHETLQSVPLMEKSEITRAQANGELFGPHQCAQFQDIVRIVGTGGTSGRPTRVGWTRSDIDNYNEMGARGLWTAGCRPDELIVNCFNYSLYAGGIMDHMTFETVGAAILPYSVGNSERLLEMLQGFPKPGIDTNAIYGLYSTPSYAIRLGEVADAMGIDLRTLGFTRGYFSGEAGLQVPGYRERIEDIWGIQARDIYGAAEFGVQSGECEHRDGLHYSGAGLVIAELIDTYTGDKLALEDGITGELVYTTLERQACPLIRLRTHDLITVYTEPCSCGRKSFRFVVRGRSDDMFIVKGVNVYPLGVQEALMALRPDITGEFYILLEKPPPIDYYPALFIEVSGSLPSDCYTNLISRIMDLVKQKCNFTPEVYLVSQGSIAGQHKTRRLYRQYNGEQSPALQTLN